MHCQLIPDTFLCNFSPHASCLKHLNPSTVHPSGSWQLLCWACQTRPAGHLIPESATDERWLEMIGEGSGGSLTHEKSLMLSGNSHYSAQLHKLDNPVPDCHQASILLCCLKIVALLLFGFLPFLFCHHSLSFLLMLTFNSSIICTLSLCFFTSPSSLLSSPLLPFPLPSSRQA